MNKCIICNKSKGELCKKCSQSPFNVERFRHYLATQQDTEKFKDTYGEKYPEIKDLNTAKFWDERLNLVQPLKEQDGMTKRRIGLAASYLPDNVKKIMDVGAGYGFLEELLSKKSIKINGNDISPDAISNLKKRFKGKFKVESIYKMDYRNEFDAVFALEVLEHIPPSKILIFFKKIKKMLRPKGYFILSIPMNEGLEEMKDNPSGHVRTYTEEIIRTELEISGFRVLKTDISYAFKNNYQLKHFLATIFKNRWQPNNIVIKAQLL